MDNSRNGHSIGVFITLAIGLSFLYWGLFYLHGQVLLPFDPASDLMGL